jgi:hypothetical protein
VKSPLPDRAVIQNEQTRSIAGFLHNDLERISYRSYWFLSGRLAPHKWDATGLRSQGSSVLRFGRICEIRRGFFRTRRKFQLTDRRICREIDGLPICFSNRALTAGYRFWDRNRNLPRRTAPRSWDRGRTNVLSGVRRCNFREIELQGNLIQYFIGGL